jgi:hypothetical protein
VPAAAVIPAPIAYIKVVAVKKLVVEFLVFVPGPQPLGLCVPAHVCHLSSWTGLPLTWWVRDPDHLL